MTSRLFPFILMGIVIASCSPVETVKETKKTISAEQYYAAGKRALQQNDWEQAAIYFNRAIKRNPKYAEAYAGAGLVLAMNEQPDKAVEYADKAVRLNARSYDAQFFRGRVLLTTQPANWFERAVASFNAALEIRPNAEEVLYYKANALHQHGDLAQAQDFYKKVSERGGEFAQLADEKILDIAGFLAAAPETEIGAQIIKKDEITRADLAALLVLEMNIVNILHRRNPNYAGGTNQLWQQEEQKRINMANNISDISGHWAESWIKDVVQVGAMDVYPDDTFRPHQNVPRMNLAMTLQHIIVQATGNTALYTAFISSPARFSDVPRSHFAFNAICLVTDYGLMSGDPATTQFDLDGSVTGLEALLALRNLQRHLNESF